MNVRVGARTDVGRVRERNEDGYLVQEPLFAVADGMGGHRGGDVASSMVLKALGQLDLPPHGPLEALVEEIKRANTDVLQRGESDQRLRGMGTTLTALLVEKTKAHLAHVGDSRAYLLRDGAFQQLTEDHTLVERMVQEGRLAPDQARRHPQRSVLTRALGVDEDIPVDSLTLPLRSRDRVLLCTDGLTGMVDEDEIRRVLEEEEDPQRASERLVEAAITGGGEDNVTVIVVDVLDEGGGDGASASAAATLVKTGEGSGSTDGRAATARHGRGASPGTDATMGATSRSEAVPDVPPATGVENEAARRSGVRWGRITLWAGLVLVMVVAALIATRLYLSRQWYVGVDGGRVAIYNGIPTEVLGVELSHVEETTDVSAVEAQRLQPWHGLDEGITANSEEDARSIVLQIREDLRSARSGGDGRSAGEQPTAGTGP